MLEKLIRIFKSMFYEDENVVLPFSCYLTEIKEMQEKIEGYRGKEEYKKYESELKKYYNSLKDYKPMKYYRSTW